jgi:hypothetical protein
LKYQAVPTLRLFRHGGRAFVSGAGHHLILGRARVAGINRLKPNDSGESERADLADVCAALITRKSTNSSHDIILNAWGCAHFYLPSGVSVLAFTYYRRVLFWSIALFS